MITLKNIIKEMKEYKENDKNYKSKEKQILEKLKNVELGDVTLSEFEDVLKKFLNAMYNARPKPGFFYGSDFRINFDKGDPLYILEADSMPKNSSMNPTTQKYIKDILKRLAEKEGQEVIRLNKTEAEKACKILNPLSCADDSDEQQILKEEKNKIGITENLFRVLDMLLQKYTEKKDKGRMYISNVCEKLWGKNGKVALTVPAKPSNKKN